MKLPFYSSCVDWPSDRLDTLEHLVDEGEEITRETFFRHVEAGEIPPDWYPHKRFYGYGFYRLPGRNIYWFTHSLIEFVFAHSSTMASLRVDLAKERVKTKRAEARERSTA